MKNRILQLAFCLAIASVTLLVSCGDDDDPLGPRPVITFGGDGSLNVVRGTTEMIEVSITASEGLSTLTAAGTSLTFTEGNPNEYAATYSYTAGDTDPIGDITVEFVATDNGGQTSSANLTVSIEGVRVELSEDITEDLTLIAGNNYVLTDSIEVTNGATLTIPAGTTISAQEYDVDPSNEFSRVQSSRLRISEDGSLVVEGTAAEPVVMTSENGNTGAWMGLRIDGDEGARPTPISLRYLRIEYAGSFEELDGDDPVYNNALRMDDVEGGTFEFIQIYEPLGGGFEIRGGTFDLKNCVVTGAAGSSSYLFRNGYEGNGQFLIANNPDGNHGDREFHFRDEAVVTLANITGIGSGVAFEDPDDPGELSSLDFGRVRESSGGIKFYNALIAEYPEDGIRGQRFVEGEDLVQNCFIFQIGGTDDDGIGADVSGMAETTALRGSYTEFADEQYNNTIDAETTLIAGIGVDDYVPDAAQSSDFDPSSLGSFFEAATYVGAIGDMDWTADWTRQ